MNLDYQFFGYLITGVTTAALIAFEIRYPKQVMYQNTTKHKYFNRQEPTGKIKIKQYYLGGAFLRIIDLNLKGRQSTIFVKMPGGKYRKIRQTQKAFKLEEK